MYRITGRLQNYAWGVPGGLQSWISDIAGVDASQPEAELWFGAHQNGPSPIVGNEGVAGLASPNGRTLRDEVDADRVPLLVKLLAAARPLSIQIHPPAEQAVADFAAQRADASLPQLLSDSMAKTEMLIAVKPFSVLVGLRDLELSAGILTAVGGDAITAANHLRESDVVAAIRSLLAIPADRVEPMADRLATSAAVAGLRPAGVDALAQVVRCYPADPGALVAALLDQQSLRIGQAVYVPAGAVHAYVRGTGVEVMTSSDNVLRLGLTPKPIAVDAALRALRPDLVPPVLDPEPTSLPGGGTSRLYEPAGAPFDVTWIKGGEVEFAQPHYRLVLAEGGDAIIAVGEDRHGSATTEVRLARGQAAAIMADEGVVRVRTSGSACIAVARPADVLVPAFATE